MAAQARTTRTNPDRLRIAAAQMIFEPTIAGNVLKIEKAAHFAARRGADVILFPECALTGYARDFSALQPHDVRDGLAAVGRIAAAARINILVGAPLHVGRKMHNCVLVYDRRGHCTYGYAKCQLTEHDEKYFKPGNAIALFKIDGVPATTVICHERRYPELVRLATMAGAQILFHPNAGLDTPEVSKAKRGGRDGVVARAFENAIYYVFANSVGPQGEGGKWSAGDSKIVGPDERVLALADNEREMVIIADVELEAASRKYAVRGMKRPAFLSASWRKLVRDVKKQAADEGRRIAAAVTA